MPGTPDPGLRGAALTSSFDNSPHLDVARAILAREHASLQLPPAVATLHAAGIVSAQPVAPLAADAAGGGTRHLQAEGLPGERGRPIDRFKRRWVSRHDVQVEI